jgi:DNA-binding CsgD family transcriptional regulator
MEQTDQEIYPALKKLGIETEAEYLASPRWISRRARALAQANGKCELCGKRKDALDVHHNCYDRLGEETDEDLAVYCDECFDSCCMKLTVDENLPYYEGLKEGIARWAAEDHSPWFQRVEKIARGYGVYHGIGDFLNRLLLHPIRTARTRAIGSALNRAIQERADQAGTTPRKEWIKAAAAAQTIIQRSPSGSGPFTRKQFENEYRKRLNDLVTKDLLGEDWADVPKLKKELPKLYWQIDESSHATEPERAFETREAEAEALRSFDAARGRLTPTEDRMVEVMLERTRETGEVCTAKEAARIMGIDPATARVHKMNAKNKRKVI